MKKVRISLAMIMISSMICFMVAPAIQPVQHVSATTTTFITVEEFCKALAKELGLKQVEGEQSSGYVNALIAEGIIKKGDITNYTNEIRRTDLMVLLNRADEYLYGDTIKDSLLQLTLERRISDIDKIKASKRNDVAKAYLKGYMKGYSNGAYSTNRELRGSSRVSKTVAMDCIKMLKDKTLRAKISPDGQLIRTTNLPKNAKNYPYILASYPNKYYEWMLRLETSKIYGENNKEIPLYNLKDYATPKNIDELSNEYYANFGEIKKERIQEWVDKARRHLELVLNVDYRTINDKWVEEVMKTDYSYGSLYEWLPRGRLARYLTNMKKNKTIVEYDKVAVDGSSLYYFHNSFYLRCYVKYRIISSIAPPNVTANILIDERPYEKILYSHDGIDIRGFQYGKWIEGYYDIPLCEADGNEGDLGIVGVIFRKGMDLN